MLSPRLLSTEGVWVGCSHPPAEIRGWYHPPASNPRSMQVSTKHFQAPRLGTGDGCPPLFHSLPVLTPLAARTKPQRVRREPAALRKLAQGQHHCC